MKTFKITADMKCYALAYKSSLELAINAEAALLRARDNFLKAVPVGATVDGFRHIRVHNLQPDAKKIKAVGLWRKVAKMMVDIQALRAETKGYSLRDLRKVGKIVTHHRVLEVTKSKKGGK